MDVRVSTEGDTEDWRRLARTVEHLFGEPMSDAPEWNRHLGRHIARGTAYVAVDHDDTVLGGMWTSLPQPEGVHIRWLAVCANARRRGAGRALVEHAIANAGAQPVHVVTFGAEHPGGDEAEAARRLYRALGFALATSSVEFPDGTPRELLVRKSALT